MWKKFASGAVIVLLAALAGAFLLWRDIRSSGLPLRTGEASLPALEAPVSVRFDAWGTPHIAASTLRDAAAAQGWLHANDRMTQMELGRRSAAGRLSEVVGEAALPLDRAARTLRMRRTAEKLWRSASPESRELLEGYAEGVNSWLEARGKDLPPGLRLLRIEPEPWSPADSLSFVLLMAADLSFWQGRPEEDRFGWLRAFGTSKTRELAGGEDLHIPEEILSAAKRLEPKAAATDRSRNLTPPTVLGSNGWVLGPSRTAAEGAIVANDPHLGLHLPSVWYQVLLRTPTYEAAGMSLPGVPGVVIGRSPHLAWGFTNTMLDDHDLFFEDLDEPASKVRRGGEWIPLETREEWIPVRGGDAVPLKLFATDRGPLLEADPDRGLPPRSLAWTMYEPSDPLAALVGLARAKTLEEIPAAVEGYVAPAQNLMVGHRDGGLLYLALGRVPERRRGDGRMPAPAWDLSYGWDGLRPLATNPMRLHPDQDLLVTANNDIRPEGYSAPFSADFDTPFRARRIEELLQKSPDSEVEDQERIQRDSVSLWALEILRLCSGSFTGAAGTAFEILASWDGSMAGTGAPVLFSFLERELYAEIFGDEEVHFGVNALGRRWQLLRLLRGEISADWFDDVTTPAAEGRQDTLEAAFRGALLATREAWGDDPQGWSYEEFHSLELEHPLGLLPIIRGFFNRGPYPLSGSSTTVNAMMGSWRGSQQTIVAGPSMRWVVDFAGQHQSHSILPGGQSGHPRDRHYDDQLPLYLDGRLRKAPWNENAITEATVSTLELRP